MTKRELEHEVERLTGQVEALQESLSHEELNGEAISDCRALLADVGFHGTFFDDVVRAAVKEIKALRYDQQRFQNMNVSRWSWQPVDEDGDLRPKRTKEQREYAMTSWFALAG